MPAVHKDNSSHLFIHFQQPKIFEINNHEILTVEQYTCNTSNLVYIITCTHCNKKYIGETKYTVMVRLQQHLYNIKNQRTKTHIVQHFGEFGKNYLSIMILQANKIWTDKQRKKREYYWINKINTIFPKGFN